jgi:hypothetical protein
MAARSFELEIGAPFRLAEARLVAPTEAVPREPRSTIRRQRALTRWGPRG